jgi:hypothetical protein
MATGASKIHPQYPLLSRVYNGVAISAVQGFSSPLRWLQGWNQYFWPTGFEPNIIKTYDTRPQLPIRYVATTKLGSHPVPDAGGLLFPPVSSFSLSGRYAAD